jgi:hypothetical protein
MLRTSEMRGAPDGPAEFHLRRIADAEKKPHLEGWTGVVEMSEK